MKKYIVLYGASGYLGSEVKKVLEQDFTLLEIGRDTKIDIEQYGGGIKAIVNCAGYSGTNNIDDCVDNVQKLKESNVDLVQGILNFLQRNQNGSIPLVHVSSGCLFHKQIGSTAETEPNNLNIYTISKHHAEDLILSNWANSLILRPRLLFSDKKTSRNPLYKIVQYKDVIESQESATPLYEFAKMIGESVKSLINEPLKEPFISHSVCPSPLNWCEIADEMVKRGMKQEGFSRYPAFVFNALVKVKLKRSSVVLSHNFFRDTKLPNNAQENALNLLDSLKVNMSIQ